MRNALAAIVIGLTVSGCSKDSSESSSHQTQTTTTADAAISYPDTRRDEVTDTYFGTEVADPYRWLEDDRSEETTEWVKAQNAVTNAYLNQIPYRDQIADTLEELLDYERETAPFFEGDYTYFYRNDGLQNQDVLYRRKGDGEAEVFLDPNGFSEDGTVSMSQVSFSRDGSLVAYQLSEGGSDWRTIVVRDAESGDTLEAPLVDVKFSGIAWRGNEGFYYSSYDKPEGSELSAMTDQHKLYFHALGTPQAEDKVVFGSSDAQKHRYVWAGVTEDDRFLSIAAANSTSGNRLFVMDLAADTPKLVAVLTGEDADATVIDSDDDTLFIKTNRDAPNGRVVRVTATAPGPENWQDVIAETGNVLSIATGSGYFFATYMVDALSQVQQYTRGGERVREIALPDLGTAAGFAGKRDQNKLYFSFTNYRLPPSIFELDPNTGETSLYRASNSSFESERFVTEQVFFESKDGTRIPMTVTYARGTPRDGSAPTLLYGYGGFDISVRPRFSSTVAAWLELGGIYAVPNIRGGGEYGKAWHLAGTKEQKQNVFDDFIAAAEFLIDQGYASKETLAVYGRSNGGLLVGAVMTQRPDLFKVALPAVGVLDMLRYHTFTAGAGWAYDYGTSEESESMFRYLKGYSPLHSLESGTDYPATLVTTADHDDRVVPAHSFKFAAELQHDHAGSDPVLIRIESDAGHGAGTPTSKIIDLYADVWGFALYNLGMEDLKLGAR